MERAPRSSGKSRLLPVLLSTVLFAIAAPVASRGQSFQPIGLLPGYLQSEVVGVSADGTVVTGVSAIYADARQAFRWVNGTISGLGFLPGANASNGYGISSDGEVVVGGSGPLYVRGQAFRWADGIMTGLGFLPGGYDSVAFGVNDDGSVVVGYGTSSAGDQAFRWVNGTMSGLGFLPGGGPSYAYGVSADGSVVVGIAFSSSGGVEAFRWADGAMVSLGFLPGDNQAVAGGANADGSVVVGGSCKRPPDSCPGEAFRWTKDNSGSPSGGTMAPLGLLDGGTFSSAYAVNADGSIVVGVANSTAHPQGEAVIWIPSAGMQSITTLLLAQAGVDLGGWSLSNAIGVSNDGTVVVGNGRAPNGQTQGWIAHLPLSVDSQIQSLLTTIETFNLASGIENSLDAKLEAALVALDASRGNSIAAACNQMAAFSNETMAQSGKKLTSIQANLLLSSANQIKTALGCS